MRRKSHRPPEAVSRSAPDSIACPGRKILLELNRHAPGRIRRVLLGESLVLASELRNVCDELRTRGVAITPVPLETLDAHADGAVHQGVVVEASPNTLVAYEDVLEHAVAASRGIVVFLDEVNDPHNVGSILRAAEAFGASGVVWHADRSAPLSPVVRKVSAGASELLRMSRVTNLSRALVEARRRGFYVLGADVHDSVALDVVEVSWPIGVVMGSEHRGLRRLTREQCDRCVHIPMSGRIESLNVGQATAVMLAMLRLSQPAPG